MENGPYKNKNKFHGYTVFGYKNPRLLLES